MTGKEKISIIVPVYNTEEFIDECINSLLKQTYNNLEVILVNDNSNESCREKLEQISDSDSRIHLFQFTERKGVGAARNFGIEKASGDFIYFLDSDDYIPERTLQLLIENIKNNDIIKGKVKNTTFSKGIAIVLEGLFQVKLYTKNRYNLIKSKSAVNFLFRRDFVINEQLRFSDDVQVYSDLAFLIPAFIKCENIIYLKEAVYFKRKRNDPISNPSLIQYDKDDIIKDFLIVFKNLKVKYDEPLSAEFLDKQFLNFYRKTIVTHFKNKSNIDEVFDLLSSTTKELDKLQVNKYDFVLKNEIKGLVSGNIDKYKRINSRHQFLRDIRNGVKTKRKFFILLYRRIFIKSKMDERLVFFESFLGKSYSDSPKYIYEYMLKNNMNYKYVWCLRDKKEDIPGKPIQVNRFSLRYFYYLAKAKYWVANSRIPKYLDKREENIYLQTWHGTPLKTLVFDINDIHSADPNYKKNFYEQSRRWDYLNSPNKYSTDIFKRAFKYEKEMLEFGYPRNDILYKNNNQKDINNLKGKLNLPLDKEVILYAPTWRDDEFFSRGNYKFTLHLDLAEMQEELGDKYILMLRTHYHIANQIDVSEFEGFVYDFSKYDDIAELYLVSDMLITDYSSVFFDYAHLKRPILFYTYDLEKYRDQLRGFYFDMEEEVPGPLLKTTDQVVNTIKNINTVNENFKGKYKLFYDKFCLWDDGHASEKTVNKVFNN